MVTIIYSDGTVRAVQAVSFAYDGGREIQLKDYNKYLYRVPMTDVVKVVIDGICVYSKKG